MFERMLGAGRSSSVEKVYFSSCFIFEVIRFDMPLAEEVLNFLIYLEIGCLLFPHMPTAGVCMLYTDSFYKYYFPLVYLHHLIPN